MQNAKFIIIMGTVLLGMAVLSNCGGDVVTPPSPDDLKGNSWEFAKQVIDTQVQFTGFSTEYPEVAEPIMFGDSVYIYNSYVDEVAGMRQRRDYFYCEVRYLGGAADSSANWKVIRAYVKGPKP